MKSSFFLSVFSLLAGFPAASFGAACCGGGFASPSLIAGDDRAQLTASYGYSQTVRDVGADSYWRRRDIRETAVTYKIEGAHVFADRWQAGLSLPFVRRARAGEASFGAGDASATLGYEFLPDWDYNPWRPKGLTFLQITAPTGRSVNESSAAYQLDARGRGFWAFGIGSLFTKVFGVWDFVFTSDAHRSLPQDYENSSVRWRLLPGWGGNAGFGGGFSPGSFRLGASLIYTYEDPVRSEGDIQSQGTPQRFATALLSLGWLVSQEWAASVAYSDQTLFGSPLNTSLGRGLAFLLQRRWQR